MILLAPLACILLLRNMLIAFLLSASEVSAGDSKPSPSPPSTCHWPNGNISSTSYPCNEDGSATACCPVRWQCLSNNAGSPHGLCFLPGQNLYERHACTDQNWEDPACGILCTQSKQLPIIPSYCMRKLMCDRPHCFWI
jgi:hypothetical protein